jgi:PncC family amidohydrolase
MGMTDDANMESILSLGRQVGARLRERKESVSIAESSAGGLISTALLAVPGASRYFRGGGVVYTHEARRELLGISDAALEGIRPSSEPYVALLAQGMQGKLGTDWVLAEAGVAGPTGTSYGAPIGHASFALRGPNVESAFTLETDDDDRWANMMRFASFGLHRLAEALGRAGSDG